MNSIPAVATFSAIALLALSGSTRAASEAYERGQYGADWPFAVDAIEVTCDQDYAGYFLANGEKYALNGIAAKKGYREPAEIRLVDSDARRVYERAIRDWTAEYGEVMALGISAVCPKDAPAGGPPLFRAEVNGEPVPEVDCPPGYEKGKLGPLLVEFRSRSLALCE